jgi:hypothetical protein
MVCSARQPMENCRSSRYIIVVPGPNCHGDVCCPALSSGSERGPRSVALCGVSIPLLSLPQKRYLKFSGLVIRSRGFHPECHKRPPSTLSGDTMTPNACGAFCQTMGLRYFGSEYGVSGIIRSATPNILNVVIVVSATAMQTSNRLEPHR